jgi:16S rRNA C967 or C1407 C5-methylase (RsmB/RsmF family)
VEPLHWYPNGYGYKLGTDRRSIRKLPALTQLHKWMIQHTDNGNLTRQEAVSMVPPIALAAEPHHRCLDMCAAPGSKTSQLLEIVNRSLDAPPDQQGLVVANDADTDRAYMLVHQCKRINSPLLAVTTHKGQQFPTLRDPHSSSGGSEFFDRVLCDVPCSGDGTLRKNPAIWSKWNTSMGVTLHPLQLMIARRGLQVLKTGGLMVYSTCSMSPYGECACLPTNTPSID